MKRCKNYVGVSCVDGSCPIANWQEYAERDIPVIRSCDDCHYYKGCADCPFCGMEYCDEKLVDCN